MVTIQIKTEVVEWLMEHEGWDAEESLSFAQEFVGMLVMSGSLKSEIAKNFLIEIQRLYLRSNKKDRNTCYQMYLTASKAIEELTNETH